ncbi:hypothetical protein FP371_24565 [Citrobacter freundii]|nr:MULTISPECIES: FxLYD domain-containing protein [Gammaproteobacteria]EEA2350439.1 hypothetical protein [Salmonella enterica subsp. enterica serovar Enteritidis]EEC4304217.1 hypothetical protein [Salmonella enterica subsp. enterica serovar Enteritidis]EEN2406641.1 hypothetical protein [Salmonella enterica subsp. enterica serovar Enteritidis]EES8921257.1 hypothetical protein [Escherichia coli]EES9862665.1 hypothetical protein [Escherichia coli]
MNIFTKCTAALFLGMVATSAAAIDVERDIDVSRVSVAYEQPYYILKGVAKNNSDRALKNLQVSFNVYEHGRVVDTITTVVKAIEPGETVRWQTPTTKSFSKFTVNQAIAD